MMHEWTSNSHAERIPFMTFCKRVKLRMGKIFSVEDVHRNRFRGETKQFSRAASRVQQVGHEVLSYEF